MILINQNSTNNVTLTLNELATSPTYSVLFEFVNDTTHTSKLFSSPDISTATDRYNRFLITENVNENLNIGTVSLSPAGYWSYTCYEMPVQSPPDLNPSNAIKILERGKVLVVSNTPDVVVEFDDGDDINNVVFE